MEEMGLPDTPAESSTNAPRTRLVDDLVVEATDVGVRQIVLVAAGMDTRVFRLPLPSDPVVFEFDNVPVLEEEQSVVDNEPAVPICRCIAVPMDLAEVAWSTAFTEAGFDISKPTILSLRDRLVPLRERETHACSITSPTLPHQQVAWTSTW